MKEIWLKHRNKGIAAVVIVVVLGISFVMGGSPAEKTDEKIQTTPQETVQTEPADTQGTETQALPETEAETVVEAPAEVPEKTEQTPTEETVAPSKPTASAGTPTPSQSMDSNTSMDAYQTQPVPAGQPVPTEPQETEVTEEKMTCTLTVTCAALLENKDKLTPEKQDILPADGILFPTQTVTFYEGESVFNVLQREMKQGGIPMEFTNTPVYNSAYIEGIGNLYEFDCGELSGWTYQVNGWSPNYGCSRYSLKSGDNIVWSYTCDLGRDINGYVSAQQ